jgi:hypothetical protein
MGIKLAEPSSRGTLVTYLVSGRLCGRGNGRKKASKGQADLWAKYRGIIHVAELKVAKVTEKTLLAAKGRTTQIREGLRGSEPKPHPCGIGRGFSGKKLRGLRPWAWWQADGHRRLGTVVDGQGQDNYN